MKAKYDLFQVSAKAILFNEDGNKMILLSRGGEGGDYSIPGGHLEPNESPEQAARREVREELGIDYDGELTIAGVDRYRLPSFDYDKIDLYYVGELAESTPISIENSGDGLSGWEWANVDDILAGKYQDWLGELLTAIRDVNIKGRKD